MTNDFTSLSQTVSQEDRNQMIDTANANYRAGKLNRKQYLKAFSVAKNINSVANRLKRFGAKVTCTQGIYTYHGVNITAEVFLDGCETDFWTIGERCEIVEQEMDDINQSEQWEQKSDLIGYLFSLDIDQTIKKSK